MLILDAYNVLHCSHVLPERWAAIDAPELCRMIDRSTLHGGKAIVVCDGQPKPHERDFTATGPSSMIHSGKGREADDLIEDILEDAKNRRNILVISNDHRVQRAARTRGARWMDCESFLRKLADNLRDQTPASPEKPTGPVDAEAWMKKFGIDSPQSPNPQEQKLSEETEHWLREFGFTDEEQEN